MILRFYNLNEEEGKRVGNFADSFPENIYMTTVLNGFDGEQFIELVIALSPAVITAIKDIVIFIVDYQSKKRKRESRITSVGSDGSQDKIENVKDLENCIENES